MVGGLTAHARHDMVFSISPPPNNYSGVEPESRDGVAFKPYPLHGVVAFHIDVVRLIERGTTFAHTMALEVLYQQTLYAYGVGACSAMVSKRISWTGTAPQCPAIADELDDVSMSSPHNPNMRSNATVIKHIAYAQQNVVVTAQVTRQGNNTLLVGYISTFVRRRLRRSTMAIPGNVGCVHPGFADLPEELPPTDSSSVQPGGTTTSADRHRSAFAGLGPDTTDTAHVQPAVT